MNPTFSNIQDGLMVDNMHWKGFAWGTTKPLAPVFLYLPKAVKIKSYKQGENFVILNSNINAK